MKKNDTREKFIVYIEELEILDSISDEDMGKLIRAMAKYVKTGEEVDVPQHLLFAFKFIISHIDRDVEKYNSVIEKRVAAGKKSAACRWGNGDAKDSEVESASNHQNKEKGNKTQNKNISVDAISQSIQKTTSVAEKQAREEKASFRGGIDSREESLSCAVGKQSSEEKISETVSGDNLSKKRTSGVESLQCDNETTSVAEKQAREEKASFRGGIDSREESLPCAVGKQVSEERPLLDVESNSMDEKTSYVTECCASEEKIFSTVRKNGMGNENSFKTLASVSDIPLKKQKYINDVPDENMRISGEKKSKINENDIQWIPGSASPWGDSDEFVSGYVIDNESNSLKFVRRRASAQQKGVSLEDALADEKIPIEQQNSLKSNVTAHSTLFNESLTDTRRFLDGECEGEPRGFTASIKCDDKTEYHEGHTSQNTMSSYENAPQNTMSSYENMPQNAKASYENKKTTVPYFAKSENSGGGMVKIGNVIDVKEKPLSNEHIKDDLQMFEEFWESYPKKINQKQAKFEFLKAEIDRETHKKILSSIERMKKTDEWRREGGRFIPYPHRYISGRRWEDDFEANNNDFNSFDTDEFFEAALRKSSESYT